MANAIVQDGMILYYPIAASATIEQYDLLNWDATKTGVQRADDTASEVFAGVAMKDFDYQKYLATNNWETYTAGDQLMPVMVSGAVAVGFTYTSNGVDYMEKVYVLDHTHVQEVTDATNNVPVGVYVARYNAANGGQWVYDVTVETSGYIVVAFDTIAVAMD
jgi:hypothetical protein